MSTIRVQYAAESRRYTVDFSKNMESDEVITSIATVAVSPTGPTLSEQVYAGKRVRFRFAGGTVGQSYKMTIRVNTSESNVLEYEFIIKVE